MGKINGGIACWVPSVAQLEKIGEDGIKVMLSRDGVESDFIVRFDSPVELDGDKINVSASNGTPVRLTIKGKQLVEI